MLAARADCPVDRLDDALLVSDAVAAHAPQHSGDGWTCVARDRPTRTASASTSARSSDGGAGGLLEAAVLPGVGNVFERVADEVAGRMTTRGHPAGHSDLIVSAAPSSTVRPTCWCPASRS